MRKGAVDLARQHGFAELEHIEAGHVDHGLFDLLNGQGARGCNRPSLTISGGPPAGCLRRGQQRTPGALPSFARFNLLPLRGQALGNPQRQGLSLNGVTAQGQATAVQRGKPGAAWLGLVQSGGRVTRVSTPSLPAAASQ